MPSEDSVYVLFAYSRLSAALVRLSESQDGASGEKERVREEVCRET